MNIYSYLRRTAKPAVPALLAAAFAFGLSTAAFAQTNPPPKWESSAGAGLTLTRGNSKTLLMNLNAQASRKSGDNELLLGADAWYGDNNDVKNVEGAHAFGQYNRLATDRLYYGVKLDYLHDGIADIRYRFTVAPLAGFYLIKQTNTFLIVEAGPGYVYQNLGGTKSGYATLRVGERFEHKFSTTAKVWQSLEFLPGLNNLDNWYANFEVGAEASLTTHASLRTVLQDTYYNVPSVGRQKNDLKLIAGIQYKF